jgi:hypothetical protein
MDPTGKTQQFPPSCKSKLPQVETLVVGPFEQVKISPRTLSMCPVTRGLRRDSKCTTTSTGYYEIVGRLIFDQMMAAYLVMLKCLVGDRWVATAKGAGSRTANFAHLTVFAPFRHMVTWFSMGESRCGNGPRKAGYRHRIKDLNRTG